MEPVILTSKGTLVCRGNLLPRPSVVKSRIGVRSVSRSAPREFMNVSLASVGIPSRISRLRMERGKGVTSD